MPVVFVIGTTCQSGGITTACYFLAVYRQALFDTKIIIPLWHSQRSLTARISACSFEAHTARTTEYHIFKTCSQSYP